MYEFTLRVKIVSYIVFVWNKPILQLKSGWATQKWIESNEQSGKNQIGKAEEKAIANSET